MARHHVKTSNPSSAGCARSSSPTPSSRTSATRWRRSLLALSLFLIAIASSAAPLAVVKTRDRRIVRKWQLSGEPHGVAVGPDGTVYVGLAKKQSVVAINPTTGELLREVILDSARIASTKDLVALRINPAGDRLIVANGSDESVTILEIPSLKIVREIGLEGEPIRDAVADPAGRYLYVLGRKVHVYSADGEQEIKVIADEQPMAIAASSDGSHIAVAVSEKFDTTNASMVSLYETATFKEISREPLETDSRIEALSFAAGDKALVAFSADRLAEKSLTEKKAKTMQGTEGSLRISFDFGDLTNTQRICLTPSGGPEVTTPGRRSEIVYFAEQQCGTSGAFIASPPKIATGSLYGVKAFAIAYDSRTDALFATDTAGYLTMYKAPEATKKQ